MMIARFLGAQDISSAVALFDVAVGSRYVLGEDLLSCAEGSSPNVSSFALIIARYGTSSSPSPLFSPWGGNC